MKYCPQCQKEYNDDSLNFCLDDGRPLVSTRGPDSESTAVLPLEAPTKPQLSTGIPEHIEKERAGVSVSKVGWRLPAVVGLAVVAVAGLFTLSWFERRTADKEIDSIAVMPFVNESGDANLEYLSDGMTESLISSLSQIPDLNIKSRTSVFRYKGKDIDAKAIGSELGVQAILNGHVLQSGENLRLGLELVDTKTDNVVWSEQYDRKQADILSLQKDIASDVLNKLRLKLSGIDKAKIAKIYTTDPAAYQLYLQGRFYWNKRTEAGTKKALELFQQAVDKDPKFALAFVGISDSYLLLGIPDAMSGVLAPKDSIPEARIAADKALEIDPTLAEGFASRAHARWKERDWTGAEADFRHSIELNGNYVYSHLFYAHYLSMLGRSDAAIAEMKRAQQIDPVLMPVAANLAFMYYSARRYDEAIDAAKKAVELEPDSPLAQERLGLSLELAGHPDDAVPYFQAAVEQSDRAQTAVASLARSYAVRGDARQARKLLSELQSRAHDQYISSYNLALIYTALDDKGNALTKLEAAYDEGSIDLLLAKVDPRLDPLRNEPRFQQIIRKLFPA